MAIKPDARIRKYHVGTHQTDQEVIDQFVVRERELGIVLDVLHDNLEAPSCQHLLVVAPRGRGKTTLLVRVVAEIRSNAELARHLLPVRLMEESQEIFTMVDFWLECLYYLAREVVATEPDFANELEHTHRDLAKSWNDASIEGRARAAVLDAADRSGRKLVIMLENLQALCDDADSSFGWELRKALQSESSIMLLASATSHFEALENATEPFFELFRVLCLPPLDTEECRRLWEAISGDQVRGRDIKPLQILTGGSPRLLVVVAGFARTRSLGQLMEQLVELIDDHTEYFRNHLDSLAAHERRVYAAIIDLWQPSTNGEIAARARMGSRKAATLIGRLVERGAVVAEGSGRKRLYSAAERLYSIYYKLRRDRDEAAVVRNLIHFMATFYSPHEMSEISKQLSVEAAQSRGIRVGLELAVSELPEARGWFEDQGTEAQDGVTENDSRSSEGSGDSEDMAEIRRAYQRGEFDRVVEFADLRIAARGADPTLQAQLEVAKSFIFRGLAQDHLGDSTAVIASYDEVLKRFGSSEHNELLVHVAMALFNRGFTQGERGDSMAEIASYDEVLERFGSSEHNELLALVAKALLLRGTAQRQLGDRTAEIASYDEVLERFGSTEHNELLVSVARTLIARGFAQSGIGDRIAAIASFDEVLERFGSSDQSAVLVEVAWAMLARGEEQGQLGDMAAATASCNEVLERFGSSEYDELRVQVARALLFLGELQWTVGKPQDALESTARIERDYGDLEDAEAIRFVWRARWVEASAHLAREDGTRAMAAVRSLAESFDPAKGAMLSTIQTEIPKLVARGASPSELAEILRRNSATAEALQPLVVALLLEAGEKVRAPAEVMEVAADIRARIEEQRDALRKP